MEDHERARIEALLEADPELRGLWEEHLEFERRLKEMDLRLHLTPRENTERKQLQKLKLAGKDKIAEILARHGAA